MDACIKNIPMEEWRIFKSESVKHGLKVGDFFTKLVREHELRCAESNWDAILHGNKSCKGMLTKADFIKIRSEFRKNFSMRGAL